VPVLLRPGAITLEMLEAELGPVRVGVDTPLPTAPGQLPRHYAPHTPVEIINDVAAIAPAARAGSALLSCAPVADTAGLAHVEVLSPSGDLEVAAAHLFAALRALDRGGFRRVYAVAIPRSASAAPSWTACAERVGIPRPCSGGLQPATASGRARGGGLKPAATPPPNPPPTSSGA
jgi:hypothetical protein